jgi:hypothetical protein
MVSIDSSKYPTYCIVFQTKSELNGYPLILGRPWLATTNAYINYRVGNMTIKNGQSQKKLVLYPLPSHLLKHKYLCG